MHWLTETEYEAWLAYRHMTRQLDARLARDLARETGLSMQDYDVLSALNDARDGRWCAKDLSAHLLWSASRLSHHLDRMQRRGLVLRAPCTRARGVDVVLTATGVNAIISAAPSHVNSVRQVFIDRLTTGDIEALRQLSRTILEGLATENAMAGEDPNEFSKDASLASGH